MKWEEIDSEYFIKCDEADLIDPIGREFTLQKIYKFQPNEVIDIIRHLKTLNILSKNKHIGHHEFTWEETISLMLQPKIKKVVEIAANQIKDPLVTKLSLNAAYDSSNESSDTWHRDGIIGPRFKVWITLFAKEHCCKTQIETKLPSLPTRPCKLIDERGGSNKTEMALRREKDIQNLIELDGEISTIDYQTGEVYVFNTNRLHKKYSSKEIKRRDSKIINRLAIVIELMNQKRFEIVKDYGAVKNDHYPAFTI